jgi:hypothetical protein
MRAMTAVEFGFSLEPGDNAPPFREITVEMIQLRAETNQKPAFSNLMKQDLLNKSNVIIIPDGDQLAEFPAAPKFTYLIPPEGEEDNNDNNEDISEQVKQIAAVAAKKLADKNKNGKVGYLKRNSDGTIEYHYLKNASSSCVSTNNNNEVDPSEKPVSIGNLREGLTQASYSMASFSEDRKNSNNSMYFLENGPFGTHAPVYDTSLSKLPKEEIDILMSIYGDETAYQYALSLIEFGKNSILSNNINHILNDLTSNEHQKYLEFLNKKQQSESSIKTECDVDKGASTSQNFIKKENENI